MGQIEMEKPGASGSLLGGNQHTGYSDNIAIHEGQIAGRYPVLFKPFAIGALVAKLREVLQQPQPSHADAASTAASTAATAATATQHR